MFEGLSTVDWNMIEAIGTWFSGIILIITIVITIWHFNFQNERKIRAFMTIVDGILQIKIINDGNKNLRIDSVGLYGAGSEFKLMGAFEPSNISNSDVPSTFKSSQDPETSIENVRSKTAGKESYGEMKLYIKGNGLDFFSPFRYIPSIENLGKREIEFKMKQWKRSPSHIIERCHDIEMYVVFIIAGMLIASWGRYEMTILLLTISAIAFFILTWISNIHKKEIGERTLYKSKKDRIIPAIAGLIWSILLRELMIIHEIDFKEIPNSLIIIFSILVIYFFIRILMYRKKEKSKEPQELSD